MAQIYYQDGGFLRTPDYLYYQDGASTRTIVEAWYQDGANLRKVWPPDLVFLTNASAKATRPEPGTATATLSVSNIGAVVRTINGSGTSLYTWLIVGAASDYDVRATHISGTVPTGTFGSWLNCGTTRSWSLSQGSLGTTTGSFTVELSQAGLATPIASATFTLTASIVV